MPCASLLQLALFSLSTFCCLPPTVGIDVTLEQKRREMCCERKEQGIMQRITSLSCLRGSRLRLVARMAHGAAAARGKPTCPHTCGCGATWGSRSQCAT